MREEVMKYTSPSSPDWISSRTLLTGGLYTNVCPGISTRPSRAARSISSSAWRALVASGFSSVPCARYASRVADFNQMAYRVVRHATEPQEPETPAQRTGREGGLKGGKARAQKLTPKERSEIARKAARARWTKQADRSA